MYKLCPFSCYIDISYSTACAYFDFHDLWFLFMIFWKNKKHSVIDAVNFTLFVLKALFHVDHISGPYLPNKIKLSQSILGNKSFTVFNSYNRYGHGIQTKGMLFSQISDRFSPNLHIRMEIYYRLKKDSRRHPWAKSIVSSSNVT